MTVTETKPSRILNTLIWIAIIPTLIGEFFKVQHWPGASALMVVGTFIFAFFYLPLFTIESWKTKETKKEKWLLFFQNLSFCFFRLAFYLKLCTGQVHLQL